MQLFKVSDTIRMSTRWPYKQLFKYYTVYINLDNKPPTIHIPSVTLGCGGGIGSRTVSIYLNWLFTAAEAKLFACYREWHLVHIFPCFNIYIVCYCSISFP